jgi:CheY-like chemotaxis protein
MEAAMTDWDWREQPDGSFIAKSEFVHMTVQDHANRHNVRYLVWARTEAQRDALIRTGIAVGVREGMRAAEDVAERHSRVTPQAAALIVLVDDDDAVRGAVAETLRDDGYKVLEATSGEGALRRLERITCPAVLVSDIGLGDGMSGLELADTVHHLWPLMGTLLVSGGDGPPPGQGTHEEFLAKPFSTAQLLGRVATIAARMQSLDGSGMNSVWTRGAGA